MSINPYKRLFDLIPSLVDPEFGIIGQVISLPRQANMPDFMYFKAIVSNTGVIGGEENFSVAGGTAVDRDRALAKAIGEGVERYSSGIYFKEDFVFGAFKDLQAKAIDPTLFTSFSKEHFENPAFKFKFFDRDTKLHWCSTINLRSGEKALAPAALVYCPYNAAASKGEAPIMESISTGLAAHLSYEAAALNGILEVVERDSFMLSWLSGETPIQIETDSLSDLHLEMIKRFERFGYRITLLNITSDTEIPTIMAVMKGEVNGSVPFLVAAATHLDPAIAAQKCLEELALIERYAKRAKMTAADWYPYTDYNTVQYLIDHIRFWLDPKRVEKSNFLLQSDQKIRLEDIKRKDSGSIKRDLNKVVQLIHNAGHEVYIADITTADVEALGFKVVRALVPGFLPLNKRYSCRPLQSKRLQVYLDMKGGNRKLNLLPHPFA